MKVVARTVYELLGCFSSIGLASSLGREGSTQSLGFSGPDLEMVSTIQNLLEKYVNPATVKLVESVEGLISVTKRMINRDNESMSQVEPAENQAGAVGKSTAAERTDVPRADGLLLKNLLRAFIDVVQIAKQPYDEDTEKDFEQTALNNSFEKIFEPYVEKWVQANESAGSKEQNTSAEINHSDDVLVVLCLCRIAVMKSEDLFEFFERVDLTVNDLEFFIQDFEDLSLEQPSSSARPTNEVKEPLKGCEPAGKNERKITARELDEFAKLALQKAVEASMGYLTLREYVKKCTRVEDNPDDIPRICVNRAEPNWIAFLLACVEKTANISSPVYEMCFEAIDFNGEGGMSSILHSVMKRAVRLRFEKCTFENKVFDLSVLKFEILNNVKELHIKNCEINSFGFLDQSGGLKSAENLEILRKLKVFDISGHPFDGVPKCVMEMKNLIELRIVDGRLSKIPDKLASLDKLEILSFSDNKLPAIPDGITNIKGLKRLFLSNNEIRSIDHNINGLKNLEELTLNSNDLSSIAEDFYFKLPKLKYLSMGKLSLYKFPRSKVFSLLFSEGSDNCLSSLERLDLSDNLLGGFPEKIGMMKNLKVLIFNDNGIESASIKAIFRGGANPLLKLEELVLSGNDMSDFPIVALNAPNLQKLRMSNCGICEIPDGIESLKKVPNLKILDFSSNKFKRFPNKIAKFSSSLEHLNLSDNREMIYSGDSNIRELKLLKVLEMRNSNLNPLFSRHICELTDLRILDLSYNTNLELPTDLMNNLKNLKELYLKKIFIKRDYISNANYQCSDLVGVEKADLMRSNIPDSAILHMTKSSLRALNIPDPVVMIAEKSILGDMDIPDSALVVRQISDFQKSRISDSSIVVKDESDLDRLNLGDSTILHATNTGLRFIKNAGPSGFELSESTVVVMKKGDFENPEIPASTDVLIRKNDLESPHIAASALVKIAKSHFNSLNVPDSTVVYVKMADMKESNILRSSSVRLIIDHKPLFQGISKLPKLEVLDISESELGWLPSLISNLTSLKTLRMNGIGINELPTGFSKLRNLRELSMNNNNFKEIPMLVFSLFSLEVLEMSSADCCIDLPIHLQTLSNLKVLKINCQSPKALSEDVSNLISSGKFRNGGVFEIRRDGKIRQNVSGVFPGLLRQRILEINNENRLLLFLLPENSLN